MALRLEEKQAVVAEVSEVASSALSAVAAEYAGLTANEMNELRCEARNGGVYLRIVKNNLAKRAVEGTEFACMQERLVGPLVLAFSKEDPGAAARVINDYAKKNDKLVIKLAAIGGKVLEASDVPTLAKLPTYDQAISLMMAVMKAPVEKLARTLNEPHAKMVRTFAAISEKKKSA